MYKIYPHFKIFHMCTNIFIDGYISSIFPNDINNCSKYIIIFWCEYNLLSDRKFIISCWYHNLCPTVCMYHCNIITSIFRILYCVKYFSCYILNSKKNVYFWRKNWQTEGHIICWHHISFVLCTVCCQGTKFSHCVKYFIQLLYVASVEINIITVG